MPGNLASSPRRNPLPTEISSRYFNPGENLPRTVTIKNHKNYHRIGTKKKDIKRIVYRNSGKFPKYEIAFDKFIHWKRPSPWEVTPWKNPQQKIFLSPPTESVCMRPNNKYHAYTKGKF